MKLLLLCAASLLIVTGSLIGMPQGGSDDAGWRTGEASPRTRPLLREMRTRYPFLSTVREGMEFGYWIDVPAGSYTIELGLGELLFTRSGYRSFSVSIQGDAVLEDLDLVAAAGPAPSVLVKTFDVVAEDDGVSIDLKGKSFEAPLAWFHLRGENVNLLVDCGGDGDFPRQGEDGGPGEALLARLGSRFFLDLMPQWGAVESSPLGKFDNKARSTNIGFRTRDRRYSLPLKSQYGDTHPFDSVMERRTGTSVIYDVSFEGLRGEIAFHAPFHPGDRAISIMPAIYVDFSLERESQSAPGQASLEFYLPLTDFEERIVDQPDAGLMGVVGKKSGVSVGYEVGLFAVEGDGESAARTGMPHPRSAEAGLRLSIPLHVGEGPATAHVVYAAYVDVPVLSVGGVSEPFLYTSVFDSLEGVVEFAAANRNHAFEASRVVDSLTRGNGVPSAVADLFSFALPSFLLNTWLTIGREGDVWYSCQEGFCRYHSTVDVEYNAALFYLWFAPDLLRLLLEEWPRFERDGVLAHDMGIDRVVEGQQYPHDMPVEENANYVLLLHQYWTATGDTAFVLERYPFVSRLLDYIRGADRDGDGFPEIGTSNTLDDASPAIQYSREQSYLAVKCAASFVAGAEMARASGDLEAAQKMDEWAESVRVTMDSEAWLDDHYAVCIDRDTRGLIDPWTGEFPADLPEPVEGEILPLEGWDSPHPYTALGLFYLLRSGLELPVDEDRILQDLRTAADATEQTYVYSHSPGEVNGWVSQNLFRDAVQCYLGDDVVDRTSKYGALQWVRARARDARDWSGFCDSPYNRHLSYYPRGMAVLAVVDAMAGFALDRRNGTLRLRPIRVPLQVPLPGLADWKNLQVPWLDVQLDGAGKPRATISELELLEELEVTIDLSRVGGGIEVLPRKSEEGDH